uniref:MEG 3.2 isoform 1; MEG 3.2 isoform 1; MEG-3 (Grail) family n=1 Tax=Schistosoma mansoni TaxID=6183 RepID=A0A5K4EPC8_SCHMA
RTTTHRLVKMLFVALILIISLHSFDCVFTARETQQECVRHCGGHNEYVTRYCGGLCSGSTGPQTFYCYLGCSHNASNQNDFDKCLPKCNGSPQLTESSCQNDCGRPHTLNCVVSFVVEMLETHFHCVCITAIREMVRETLTNVKQSATKWRDGEFP